MLRSHLAFVLATALFASGTPVVRAEDVDQLSDAKLRVLDDLEAEILKKATAGQLERQTIEAGLSLADTRIRTHSGDPYKLLSALRPAIEGDKNGSAFLAKLARIYLAADLPWDTVSLLEPHADQLDHEGQETLEKARMALDVIRQDAAAVAPRASLYLDLSPLGSRLVDLLGIPLDSAGSYSDFTRDLLKRKIGYDKDDTSADLAAQAELERVIEGPPLLTLMLGGAPPQHVQKEVAARRTEPPPLRLSSADTAALARLLERVRATAPSADIPLSSTERAFVFRLAAQPGHGGKNGGPLFLKRTAAFRGSLAFLFQAGSGDFVETGRGLIAVDRRDADPQAFVFETFNPVAVHAIDAESAAPQHIALSAQRIRSDSPLDLDVFDPESGRLWKLTEEAYHGEYHVLSLGDSNPPAIMVSMSTHDRRFGDCNQCPARRLAWLVRYDRATHDYVTVAERRTGADLSARTNQNLMGLSPEMVSHADISAPLARLAGRSPAYLRKKFKEDVGTILQHVEDVQFEERQFPDAAVVLRQMVENLSRDGDAPQIRGARATAQTLLIEALLFSGDTSGAMAITQDPRVEADAAKDPDNRQVFLNVASLVAMVAGDYAGSERFLTPWRNAKQESASEGTFARFLSLVGDQESARKVGLKALNLAVKEEKDDRVAIDMFQLADVALKLGDAPEALDWLSRALRITRRLRDSEKDAAVLQIAADIALQNRLPNVALLLLDQAAMTASELMWATNGASILLLYGQALEQLQDLASADLAYSAASDLARRDRGSVYITAQSLRADLAKRRGDRQAALRFAGDAFRTVLDGRSRVGQESYKFSFITTSRTAAEKYFDLQVAAGAPASEVLGDIEAWRLQVFKDIYRGQLGGDLAPTLIADRLSKALNPGEAYVAFTILDTKSFAVVVAPGGASLVPLSIDRARVERDVNQLHDWLNTNDARALFFISHDRVPAELETELRSLYDTLIAPLHLPPGTTGLLVSPDEALTALPWSALLQPSDSRLDAARRQLGFQALHPLSERMAIGVVPSVQVLLQEAGPHRDDTLRPVGLIGAFGGVPAARLAGSLPLIAGADLPELHHGPEELSAIATAMKGQSISILLDSGTIGRHPTNLSSPGVASRAAVLALLPAASMIHIAGHAVFDSRTPMQSRIFLDSASDSALSAEDLVHLDLSHARLVVLSACETGRGQIATGAETFGFLRGLMGAGARSVILTQWSVDDEVTSAFFATFYRELAQRGAAEALRLAEMEIFRKHPHPFYWAAPTLFGWWR